MQIGNFDVEQRQLIGFAGVGSLTIGSFAPLLTLPGGSVNYVAQGQGDGIIILALTAVCAYLVWSEKYQRLWIPGGLAAVTCLVTFAMLSLRLTQVREEAHRQLAGNPFRGLVDVALNTVGFGWGWAFLLLGLGCLFCAALPPGGATSSTGTSATDGGADKIEPEPEWVHRALAKMQQLPPEQSKARIAEHRALPPGARRTFGKRFSP